MKSTAWIALAVTFLSHSALAQTVSARVGQATPLSMGETFTIESRVLGETRRINVYLPPVYTDSAAIRASRALHARWRHGEDFLHVAGLVQVSVGNGTMRPFVLVGIENTQRRRDLTGPTESASDRKIAPQVGGSPAFRRFIRDELMPLIKTRYQDDGGDGDHGRIAGGAFVMETFFVEPELFDTYIAFDPSLWWNNQDLVQSGRSLAPQRESPANAVLRQQQRERAGAPGAPARRHASTQRTAGGAVALRIDAQRDPRDDLSSCRAGRPAPTVQTLSLSHGTSIPASASSCSPQ